MPITALVSAIGQRIAALIARRAAKAAEAQLHAMDDRTLKDIGMHRSEIASILRDLSGERRHGPIPMLAIDRGRKAP